ncbi:hypothetical protein [Arsenophonus apicola]|uniref:Uncharacterized protein n=1 Tax=Arsenophonus apicola TaxID=2879119 RepID=A0ABY8P5C2_9GAMM|nr:hypothetical protein [Arsenophonus apicola]WGO84692.1 hypothetical protein QG404_07470 [Arsenophonus apicola]
MVSFFIPNWSGNEDIDRIVRVLQEKITEVYNDYKNMGFGNLPSNYKKTFSITTKMLPKNLVKKLTKPLLK